MDKIKTIFPMVDNSPDKEYALPGIPNDKPTAP
jgi:hypothetical protein